MKKTVIKKAKVIFISFVYLLSTIGFSTILFPAFPVMAIGTTGASYQFSTGFSSTQGQNQWYYKQFDGINYSDMTWDDTNKWWKGNYTYCIIGRGWAHPQTNEAIIGWQAPISGTITITGSMNVPSADGDGTSTYITQGSTINVIWPTLGTGPQMLNSPISSYHVLTATVNAGDLIYFHVNQNANMNSDTTNWDPIIKYNAPPKFTIGKTECVMTPTDSANIGINMFDTSLCFVNSDLNGNGHFYHTLGGNTSNTYQKMQGTLSSPAQSLVWNKTDAQLFTNPNNIDARWKWWFSNIYVDNNTYTGGFKGQLAFCHIEDWTDPNAIHFGIGLAYSKDGGNTFTKLGIIITPDSDPYGTISTGNIAGCPYNINNGYFYVYFGDINSDTGLYNSRVARANVAEVINAATSGSVTEWHRYYEGAWNQPGLGGHSDSMQEVSDSSQSVQNTHGDSAYSNTKGKYVLAGFDGGKGTGKGVSLAFSNDGVHWGSFSPIQIGIPGNPSLSPYVSIVNIDGSDNGIVGSSFYVYFAYAPDFDTNFQWHLNWQYRVKVTLQDNLVQEQTWQYQSSSDGFYIGNNINALWQGGSQIGGSTYGGNDPYILSGDNLGVSISEYDKIKIKMRNWSESTQAQVFFTTTAEPYFDSAKSFQFTTKANDLGVTEYVIDTTANSKWTGTLKQLRFDTSEGVYTGSFALDSISLTNEPMDYQSSIGFGATDGAENWYNRQSDGSSYGYMTWDAAKYYWVGSEAYCMIGSNWQHPGMNYESVRVWLAPASGRIKVSSIGSISVGNGTGADGVKVKVVKNSTQVWPSSGWQTITAGASISFPNTYIDVQAGDAISFIVDKNVNNYYDSTFWEPKIDY